MQPLTTADIVDIARYEAERPEFRSKVIELKRHRRVPVGDIVTLVFENRDTVRFQVQEMMRAERIVREDRIQEEVDVYNELIPGPGKLSATVFIEVTDRQNLRLFLDKLIGIDKGETTFLVIGQHRIAAEYEGGHSKEERISAVHYATFTLDAGQAAALAPGGPPAKLVIDHPNYHEEAILSDDVRASLAADLMD